MEGNSKIVEAEPRVFEQNGYKGHKEFGGSAIKARARKQSASPWAIAFAYAFLGDNDQTLKFLENAFQERSPSLVFFHKEPGFDFLRSDERYRAMVKNMGLPPGY